MIILIDSREQTPLDFSGYDCSVQTATLSTGDYSILGLEHKVAIERKSLNDLAQSFTKGRERFERECQRGMGLEVFSVVVEGTWSDLAHSKYKSRINANALMQSIISWQVKYNTPFFFAGNAKGAAFYVVSLFRQYVEQHEKQLRQVLKAYEQHSKSILCKER